MGCQANYSNEEHLLLYLNEFPESFKRIKKEIETN